jgi:hypothetical protein
MRTNRVHQYYEESMRENEREIFSRVCDWFNMRLVTSSVWLLVNLKKLDEWRKIEDILAKIKKQKLHLSYPSSSRTHEHDTRRRDTLIDDVGLIREGEPK